MDCGDAGATHIVVLYQNGNRAHDRLQEDSLTISMAILAAPYVICQPVPLPRVVAPSLEVSRVS